MSEPKRIDLGALDAFLKAAPGNRVYGFVVSQAIYDDLKAKLPSRFAGGNCFDATPVIVDPALPPTEMDVATTREAWIKRLQEIKS